MTECCYEVLPEKSQNDKHRDSSEYSGLQTALWCHAIVLMFCAVLWSDASSCLSQCVTHNTVNHLLYMMLSCCVPESLYSCFF